MLICKRKNLEGQLPENTFVNTIVKETSSRWWAAYTPWWGMGCEEVAVEDTWPRSSSPGATGATDGFYARVKAAVTSKGLRQSQPLSLGGQCWTISADW